MKKKLGFGFDSTKRILIRKCKIIRYCRVTLNPNTKAL